MDILSALHATAATTQGTERCKVARWLNDIPDTEAGKDGLVAAFANTDTNSDDYRKLTDLSFLARTLGFKVSTKTIALHRAKNCPCYGRSA